MQYYLFHVAQNNIHIYPYKVQYYLSCDHVVTKSSIIKVQKFLTISFAAIIYYSRLGFYEVGDIIKCLCSIAGCNICILFSVGAASRHMRNMWNLLVIHKLHVMLKNTPCILYVNHTKIRQYGKFIRFSFKLYILQIIQIYFVKKLRNFFWLLIIYCSYLMRSLEER